MTVRRTVAPGAARVACAAALAFLGACAPDPEPANPAAAPAQAAGNPLRMRSGPPDDVRHAQAAAPAAATVPPAEAALSRPRVRALVEEALAGRLADRELTADDYDRVADAVMRIHDAVRTLRATPPDLEETHPVREAQRAAILAAFADVAAITGIPVTELGALGDLPGAEAGAPASGATP